METAVSLINDLIIIIFDLSLYIMLTPLKRDNTVSRVLAYGGCTIISIAYAAASYIFSVPYALASFCCMSIPSFFLFLYLSKYKNARFIVTFCFVDTITLILAFIAKTVSVFGEIVSGIISAGVLLILCVTVYFVLRPYASKYKELMERVATGWTPMALSTALIYLLLIFTASYPKPMIERMEYIPVYGLLSLTVISFYIVFVYLILQKAKLTRANYLLEHQRKWREMAYLDELTQLANQAAYAGRLKEIKNQGGHEISYALIVFDIDNFKDINDVYGHYYGNCVLRKTADFFVASFSEKHYELFRIGGDEFAAIVRDVPERKIQAEVRKINEMPMRPDLGCTYSCGYSMVDFSLDEPFEDAFIRADKKMYQVKHQKKGQAEE